MPITIPNVFVAGTRIESAPVNANFAAITNALDKTGDTLTGNLTVGTGITIDGLDISTIPQTSGTFNPNGITFTNITVTGGSITGITDLAIADGGTGASTAQAAINALAGATTSGQYLRGNGTNVTMSAIQAGDVPTLNQSTTGSAASLSISGQTGLLTVTGLTSTNRAKTVRDAADTLLELGGSYTPTGTWNWTSATATWPTFNQNTTGTAAGLSATLAVASGGTGQTTYTDGQLLIGNTTGNTLTKATLTAGSGVSITNGNGSITIAATGSGGTVTSVGGTGTVNGITLTGTVTSTGNLTLGGTLSGVDLTTQVTGTLPLANGGTGQTSAQAALNALAAATTSGQYLRGNGTNVVMSAIQAADVPTLNQNTTGTAAGLSSTLAVASGGTGQTTYTDGQLLIGNTTGNTLTKATLTAGSGISITNGSGSITIAATGGGGTVTSVSGTGSANGLSLSGTVTGSGNITLSGTVNSMEASAGTVSAPSIAVSGDTNTGFYFPAADTVAITTGGVERLKIDGTTLTSANESGANSFDLIGAGSTIFRLARYSDDASNALIVQRKARGTVASPTAVATSDTIGSNQFQAYGGTNWRNLATIQAWVTTYTSDTDMTSHLSFSVTSASSAAVERLRLTGFGDLAIATNRKILLDGVGATGDTYLQEISANNIAIFTGGSERVRIDGSGNVGVNVTSFGTSAAGVFAVKNGTEPSSGPADTVQFYSVDRSAGNTIPAFYCEGTGVTSAGITSTTVTTKIAVKVNGTVYYLLATTNAT